MKKLRERAGVPGRDAGQVVGMDQAKMSHLEAGRAAAGAGRVRKLAAYYGVSDTALVDALADMTRDQGRGWWEEYRGILGTPLLDLAELEHHARSIRAFQVVHVPGLLQTEEHVRALYSHSKQDLPPERLDAVVGFRVRRRQVLEGERPPRLDALVHEAALHIRVGDRKVARRQLEFMLEQADRANVSLRVIPFETDGFTEASFPMHYLEGPVSQLDTAQFDAVDGSYLVDDVAQLANYRRILEAVEAAALPQDASLALIARVARQL